MAFLAMPGALRSCSHTAVFAAVIVLAGCATQAPPVSVKESPQPAQAQAAAQRAVVEAAPAKPQLKRKIALGRITNETRYGRSLLRDNAGDPLGKQVTDLMSKSLTESGAYVVLERPDINRIQDESRLTGAKSDLVGADALVIGSLTEFGRKTIGQTGFVSSSKKQVAFAKVDLRVVDVSTGQAFFATSGSGESSTEAASTFGFGSQAAYDSTLDDSAIRQAVSEAVNNLTRGMAGRPWQTYVLSIEGNNCYLAGGKAQGLKPGTRLSVLLSGKRVKSPQTGFEITLPGREIAQLRVDGNFGDNEANEGSVASVVSGSLQGAIPDQLVVRSMEAL